MDSYGKLKKLWDEYRTAKQYISQGDLLEEAAANRKMVCPRCKGHLEWNEHQMFFYCPTKRCGHKESSGLNIELREGFIPPAGSHYWVITTTPPRWFIRLGR